MEPRIVTASPTSLRPAARKAATLSAGKQAALSGSAFHLKAGDPSHLFSWTSSGQCLSKAASSSTEAMHVLECNYDVHRLSQRGC